MFPIVLLYIKPPTVCFTLEDSQTLVCVCVCVCETLLWYLPHLEHITVTGTCVLQRWRLTFPHCSGIDLMTSSQPGSVVFFRHSRTF